MDEKIDETLKRLERECIRLEAENRLLKTILEQKLEITLIPKLNSDFI